MMDRAPLVPTVYRMATLQDQNRKNRPTLADLRARVFKGSHPGAVGTGRQVAEIGNLYARKVARPSAVYGTWLAVRLGLSAHQVTLLALLANLAAALAMGMGSRSGFVAGALLAQLGYWLDHVDGQVARWRETSSLTGVYFDYLMHHATTLFFGFAIGFGLAIRSGHLAWTVAGFLIAVGWHFQSLQNDCRYKALFQRLKAETLTYRVSGGSGGRPEPPTPWPRRGLRAWTWPAYKACEPHVVLLSLSALALAAVASEPLAFAMVQAYAAGMALAAPLLAVARIGKAIGRGAPDEEFSRWFSPRHRNHDVVARQS